MIVFDKVEIRQLLTLDNIYELLVDWGGEPEYTNFGLISATICHNIPGEGSKKLYFYSNSNLFHCYTGCADPSFDIFELVRKVANIQWGKNYDLNDAVRWIAHRFGISGEIQEDAEDVLEDWKIFSNYDRIQEIEYKISDVVLKEYDKEILDRFNYNVRIEPWIREGISQSVLEANRIGFYPGNDQITIPHFDKDGRFIGLRGRTLSSEEGQLYGKYRPIKVNQVLYNHPLGMNLYGLNQAKPQIAILKKAIVFESEKSVLMYQSHFGLENNVSVACCGSSFSSYQAQLLIEAGAQEIIIAFDRQFEEIGNDEFKRLKNKLIKIVDKYKNDVLISLIFDKKMITSYKASPIDEGPEKFLQLFKERIIL